MPLYGHYGGKSAKAQLERQAWLETAKRQMRDWKPPVGRSYHQGDPTGRETAWITYGSGRINTPDVIREWMIAGKPGEESLQVKEPTKQVKSTKPTQKEIGLEMFEKSPLAQTQYGKEIISGEADKKIVEPKPSASGKPPMSMPPTKPTPKPIDPRLEEKIRSDLQRVGVSVPDPITQPKPQPTPVYKPPTPPPAKPSVPSVQKDQVYTPQEYLQRTTETASYIGHLEAEARYIMERTPYQSIVRGTIMVPSPTTGAMIPVPGLLGGIRKQVAVKQHEQVKEAQTQIGRLQTDIGHMIAQVHPETKIIEKPTGEITLDVPYLGAEKYYEYKRMIDPSEQKSIGEHIGAFMTNLGTALTHDPLGIASSYYASQRDYQKALDVKIEATHKLRTTPFWQTVIGMPTVQIGAAGFVGSYVGTGVTAVSTKLGTSAAGYMFRGGMYGVGIGLGAVAVKDIYDTVQVKGIGEALAKTTVTGFTFAAGTAGYLHGRQPSVIQARAETVHKGYVKLWKATPTGIKKFGFNLKQGVKDLKFKMGKTKGLYKEGDLRDIYSPGDWKELSYNVVMRESFPFRTQRYLVTKTGETIPLETYHPVIPSKGGRIVDIGKIPGRIPKLATGKPKQWWVTHTDAIAFAGKKPIFKSFKDLFKPTTGITKTGLLPPKTDMKVVSIKTVKTSDYFPKVSGKYINPFTAVKTGFRMPTGYALAYGAISLKTLAFLEEGLQYTSSKWKTVKPSPAIKPITDITPAGITTSDIIPSVKIDIAAAIKPDITPVVAPAIKPKSDIILKPDQALGLMDDLLKDVEKDIGTVPVVTPKQTPGQKQRMKQIVTPKFITPQFPELLPPPTPIPSPVRPFKIKGIPFIRIPTFAGAGKKIDKETIKPGQGYNVFVKDRYIVKGKKKYQEKFTKLNKKPLSESDALSFGATVVDNSAAASFKIKPVSGTPMKPSIPVKSWGHVGNMFYKRKDTYIERTRHRISTPGEIAEISARGWVAEKRKLQPKIMKIKPPKTIRMGKELKKQDPVGYALRRYGF